MRHNSLKNWAQIKLSILENHGHEVKIFPKSKIAYYVPMTSFRINTNIVNLNTHIFYKQNFYKQHQVETGKKLSKS